MEKTQLLPPIQWAQRKDRLFVTINIRDIANEKIDLKENAISFSGFSDSHSYSATINLFKEVDPQESKWTKIGLHLQIILIKKNQTEEFWPRLTKEETKFQNISIDWNKYVDEDEENEAPEAAAGPGWDANQMEGFNQNENEDSDDEENGNLDDLDKDAEKFEDDEPQEKKEEENEEENKDKPQEPTVSDEKKE